jgi:hypothetical protein
MRNPIRILLMSICQLQFRLHSEEFDKDISHRKLLVIATHGTLLDRIRKCSGNTKANIFTPIRWIAVVITVHTLSKENNKLIHAFA